MITITTQDMQYLVIMFMIQLIGLYVFYTYKHGIAPSIAALIISAAVGSIVALALKKLFCCR